MGRHRQELTIDYKCNAPERSRQESDVTNQIPALLANLCEDIEAQLKSHIRGGTEDIIRGYLPQAWVFETEEGSLTIYIDTDCYARVHPGADKVRDVTIVWTKESLEQVLTARNRDKIEPGMYPIVMVSTEKGRAAFNYLRKEIGL